MHILYRYILVLSALLALFSACSDREDIEPIAGNQKIRFELFARSGSQGLPAARSGANENSVSAQPWVLVFRGTGTNASFVEAVQAEEFSDGTYVYLTSQSDPCQLLVLANSPNEFYVGDTPYTYSVENFEFCLSGRDLTYASTNLITVPLSNPQTTRPYVGQNLPMSALVSVPKVDVGVAIPQVVLERIVAKVVVKSTAPGFELMGITAMTNVAKRGKLHNLTGTLSQNIGSASLVEYRANNSYSSDIAEAVPVTGGQSTEENPLYFYETHTLSNNTYMIIRAMYEGQEFFYKMAFINHGGTSLNISRNTEYTFTITSIRGRGFSSVADAKASLASNTNLDYFVLLRDESGYEIITNNDYYMGVTNSHLELHVAGGTTSYTAFTLITNCNTVFPTKRTITSLTSGLEIVSPADGKIPVSTTVPYNVEIRVTSGFTSGEIEIHLGNLRKVVTVRKHTQIPASGAVISDFIANGYYVYAAVEDASTHTWLKLLPVNVTTVNDPGYIYVDNGLINLSVGSSTVQRDGVVYVSTGGGTTQRIKVIINQRGVSSN